jgi:hypothetical protein
MMLNPPSLLARRNHMHREEQTVVALHSAGLTRLLDCAIETRDWTIVSLCRDRLNYLAWKAKSKETECV